MPDAIPTDAPAAAPTPADRVDLNSPSTRVSHRAGIEEMIKRRRENVLAEMSPDAAAELVATRDPVAAPAAAGADREDTDAADAIAQQHRARLEQQASEAESTPAAAAPSTPAPSQLDRQRGEMTIIDEADLPRYGVRTKVRGTEEILPLDDVRTGFQKNTAADTYLREARELLAEVKTAAKQHGSAPGAAPAGTADEAAAPSTTGTEPDPIDAAVDAMFHNDDATAKDLLRKALARNKASQADPDQFARAVEQRIVVRSALRQFAKDHRVIYQDPILRAKADEYLTEATGGLPLEQLEPDAVMEAFDTAGRRTKEWIAAAAGIKVSANPAPAPTPRADVAQRKATIDEPPVAGTRRDTTVPASPNASTTIQRMAASRPGAHRMPGG